MPLTQFICPDNGKISIQECLAEGGCRLHSRCASRSYLRFVSQERLWTGRPSTTQLIQGTMCAFLKLTKEYAISPDQRAFMIHGTKGHNALEGAEDEFSLLEERFDDDSTEITGIADFIEVENGVSILGDYKTSGSFKVAKALGFFIDEEDTGEIYKTGKRKGEPKMRKILRRLPEKEDRWEWELQLNKYRLEIERRGFKIDNLKIQCCVRDGNTFIARSRGVFRNIYYFDISILDDTYVKDYFYKKHQDLLKALKQGYWELPCSSEETWEGLKCASYCEVAEHCSLGKYLKKDKEADEMAIKNLSEIVRLPRAGKIRLGVKKKNAQGKEYPSEVDYFILDPETPTESERKRIIDAFHSLYGEQPKEIKIMIPLNDRDVIFSQFYKRYGSSTLLKCKGDGVEAVCSAEEYAQGLEVLGKTDLGLPKVACLGKECPYQKKRECSRVGTLQVLLPELPGAGVWQITTGSYGSIININSCLEYVKVVAGRFNMIPLLLQRRETEMMHEGKKTKHYTLHIDMGFALADIQRLARVDSTKIMLELPEPDISQEDIYFQENKVIDPPPEIKKDDESVEDIVSDLLKSSPLAAPPPPPAAQKTSPPPSPQSPLPRDAGKEVKEMSAAQRKEMNAVFAQAKKALGEENYNNIIYVYGYNDIAEIKTVSEGNKVLLTMKQAMPKKET